MIKIILKIFRKYLYNKKNVCGLGVGTKIKDGEITGESCITVAVKRKGNVDKKDIVPKRLLWAKTDIVGVGDIKYLWRQKHRPLKIGASCCWIGSTACSAGLPVWNKDGDPYLLMNKHCIMPYGAKVGDVVINPGPVDGGTEQDRIGEVSEYFFPEDPEKKDNIDYALVKLDKEMAQEDVEGNTYIPEFQPVKMFQRITKGSRTTQDVRTSSPIISTDFEATVKGHNEKIYHYPNSVLVLNTDENGDAIVEGGCSSSVGIINNRPLVQTYAGSMTVGVFNKIELSLEDIKKRFGLDFYLTKPAEKKYYIAAGRDWYIEEPQKTKTTVNLNLRSEPKVVSGTYIKTLPKGTEIEVVRYVGSAGGYEWLEIKKP